jgi:hypothetical protein
MVRIHPDPPTNASPARNFEVSGAIAQLGERLLCKQEVIGSIPIGSTSNIQTRDTRRERNQQSTSRAAMLIGDSSNHRSAAL